MPHARRYGPPSLSAPNGGWSQSSALPSVTTSVCASKSRVFPGLSPSHTAHTFGRPGATVFDLHLEAHTLQIVSDELCNARLVAISLFGTVDTRDADEVPRQANEFLAVDMQLPPHLAIRG